MTEQTADSLAETETWEVLTRNRNGHETVVRVAAPSIEQAVADVANATQADPSVTVVMPHAPH